MTAQTATRPSPLTVAPIASRNRRAFTGHADAVREATHAAYDRITARPEIGAQSTPPPRSTGRYVPAHRLHQQLAAITSEPYRLWVLGEGPKPYVPA